MKNIDHNTYAEFCNPESVQKDSRFLARQVAAELGYTGSLVSTSECKRYADSLSYAELAPALTAVGKQIALELVKYQRSPAVQLKVQALSALLAKTFPVLGKGSVRHDVRKTAPTPSKGIDPETFTTANRGDVYTAFGFGPKAEKASALSPLEVAEFSTVDHSAVADMGDAPVSEPLPEGTARNSRGDVTYTYEGTMLAAQQAAHRAAAEALATHPDALRSRVLQARLQRVIRQARTMRANLAKARAELAQAQADLDAARMAPAVPKRAPKRAAK